MIVTLPDGNQLKGNITSLCTGYVAKRIELEPSDVRTLLGYISNDHAHELVPILRQLQHRWRSERARLVRKAAKAKP